jgi:PAS domain S-box-containing protein
MIWLDGNAVFALWKLPMLDFLTRLFDPSGFMDRNSLGGWSSELVWLHNVSDALIWLACLAILVVLVYFIRRRRDLPFPFLFWLFGAFILSCGLTHLMDVIVTSTPVYRLAGVIKLVTALASWATVIALVPVMAKAVATSSPEALEREIEERKRVEGELRKAHEQIQTRLQTSSADLDLANEQVLQLAAIVESSEDAIVGCTLGGVATIWNRGAERLFGYSAEEVIGQPTSSNTPLDWPDELRAMKRVRNGEYVAPFETVQRRKDGKEIHVSVSVSPIRERDGRIVGASAISRDISERKRLEQQVRQSQKMEAIGQLAGGVAHDFNNLLTIISGYSEMLLIRLPTNDPGRDLLHEIHKAGERAASLTRQLLAFSRKQIVEPKVLNLNALVSDMEKMLGRMIGEDVTLTTKLAPGLGSVKADPGQIEQVLMNLAVNARDAMPQGGKLTIETANVELDHSDAAQHPEIQPGPYVMLAVTDTGCGMSQEVQARVFEPFFTTKESGKGTGLGLATVYGIVKQSGGYVYVYSEPGHGTTFKVYLPLVKEKISSGKSHGLKVKPRGTETVLLVEDEPAVRSLTRFVLQSHGYTVLEASSGVEAIRLTERHRGPIHLLMTDVVMPGMNGRQVAERVTQVKTGFKVLYLSGYTDDAVVRHGILQEEVAFLQKPYTPGSLLQKVRDVLDQVEACV